MFEFLVLIFLLIDLLLAAVCGFVAMSKNRNPWAWGFLSLLLGPIAWLALAMVGPYPED